MNYFYFILFTLHYLHYFPKIYNSDKYIRKLQIYIFIDYKLNINYILTI